MNIYQECVYLWMKALEASLILPMLYSPPVPSGLYQPA